MSLERERRGTASARGVMCPIDQVLPRLEGVREVGTGRWMAKCPEHDDRSPSLSIRELNDGRVLIHDFGGCSAADVLAAVGLSLADLFPKRFTDHLPAVRDRQHMHAAREVLKALDDDALLVAIAAENVARGIVLDDADRQALINAAARIREMRRVAT